MRTTLIWKCFNETASLYIIIIIIIIIITVIIKVLEPSFVPRRLFQRLNPVHSR
jgi:hypothetical protein